MKTTVTLKRKDGVITVENDRGTSWRYYVREGEEDPTNMTSSVITSLLQVTVLQVLTRNDGNIKFSLEVEQA